MISSFTKTVKGETQTFRLGARAMMALEDHFEQGILKTIEDFQTSAEDGTVRMSTLITIISEIANDGDGMAVEDASKIFDAVGTFEAVKIVGQCVDKAFPEAKKESAGKPAAKNAKGAARSK